MILIIKAFADGVSYAVKVRCRADVFSISLSGSGSLVDETKLECKVISEDEEKQPVGMFPSGCLKWINLSSAVS